VRRRAWRVVERLKAGVKLPEALRLLDDSGELQWRMSNALRRGKGFLQALGGWHEALDAKAFQQEQTAAQITTSALVFINGLFVAALVCAVFLALVNLLNAAALW
jgi:type II secretory pathway component PulF